ENAVTFDEEVQYIWSKPWTAWVKTVFLFLRYFPLAIQLHVVFHGFDIHPHHLYRCNRILDEKIIQQQHLAHSALRAWYISQVIVAHLAMTGVEVVMMARVYALYHNSRWVGGGFLCLWLGETIVVIAGLFITLPGIHFEPEQFLLSVPHSFAYLAISALVSQAIILGLTLLRFFQGQWSGTSLGKLLLVDGCIVYVVFFAATFTAAFYSIMGLKLGMTEYAWFLSIISSAGCRLILNMQRLPSSRNPDRSFYRSSSLELTTLHHDIELSTVHHHPEP
ncbi:hypothetical protein B0H14DRAFT_3723900, partial [Mycena olivaceomarginata]